jgi:hypothetical protein
MQQQQCQDIYEDLVVSATRVRYPHAARVHQLLAARACVPLLYSECDRAQLGAWVGACERALGSEQLVRKVAAGGTLSPDERARAANATDIF